MRSGLLLRNQNGAKLCSWRWGCGCQWVRNLVEEADPMERHKGKDEDLRYSFKGKERWLYGSELIQVKGVELGKFMSKERWSSAM